MIEKSLLLPQSHEPTHSEAVHTFLWTAKQPGQRKQAKLRSAQF